MSAYTEQSYSHSGFVDPDAAQHKFASQFDLREPEKAMNSYQKIMHQHTKQQFEMATASSRRRSSESLHGTAPLVSEASRGSVSSTGS